MTARGVLIGFAIANYCHQRLIARNAEGGRIPVFILADRGYTLTVTILQIIRVFTQDCPEKCAIIEGHHHRWELLGVHVTFS
jgi:hypothetical protein